MNMIHQLCKRPALYELRNDELISIHKHSYEFHKHPPILISDPPLLAHSNCRRVLRCHFGRIRSRCHDHGSLFDHTAVLVD